MSCVFCHFFNIFKGCFLEVLSSLDQFHRAELAQVDLDAGAFKKWKEAPQKTSVDLPIASNCNPFHILLYVSMYVHIFPSNLLFWILLAMRASPFSGTSGRAQQAKPK